MNKSKQKGITILGLLTAMICVVFGMILVMRVVPAYIENYKISKALDNLALHSDGTSTPTDIRTAFQKQADVDSIAVITGRDLKIGSEKNAYAVTADYEARMSLLTDFYLVIHFDKTVRLARSD